MVTLAIYGRMCSIEQIAVDEHFEEPNHILLLRIPWALSREIADSSFEYLRSYFKQRDE